MNVSEIEGLARTEADIVAEFSHLIRADGRLRASMEARLPSKHHRSGKFRVDALVSKQDGEIVCAVEFKRPGKKVGARTRQRNAYADLPFPHFYIVGRTGLKRVMPLIYAAADLETATGAYDAFGKSAISRTGRVKKSAVWRGI